MRRLTTVVFLCLVTMLRIPASAAADEAPRCPPGETPSFTQGFALLAAHLGGVMGEPITCAHADPQGTGDVLQQTATGLAFWRKSTNTPTFTNGWEHWALTERGLVFWTGESIDPPEAMGHQAAFLSPDGATLLLEPDGGTRFLSSFPTRNADIPLVALSPDARWVLTTRLMRFRSEVVLVSVEDGRVQAVPGTAERDCRAPAFLPDGIHLLATCAVAESATPLGRRLELFHLEQGHVRTILQGDGSLRPEVPLSFPWGRVFVGPDGAHGLVEEFTGDGGMRQWWVSLSTGATAPFMIQEADPFFSRVAAFLPDGRLLATICDHCGWLGPSPPPAPTRTAIVVLRQDGGIDTILHRGEGLVYAPALSPDGAILLFTTYAHGPSGEIEPQLWQLTRSTGVVQRVGTGEAPTFAAPSLRG